MPDGTNLAATTDKRLVLLIDEVTSLLKRNETSEALGLLANCRTLVAAQSANGQTLPPSGWEEIEARIQLQREEVLGATAAVAVAMDSLNPDTHYNLVSVLDQTYQRLHRAAGKMDDITREVMGSAGKATQERDTDDASLESLIQKLDHDEQQQVLAFVQGLIASRSNASRVSLLEPVADRQEADDVSWTMQRYLGDHALRVYEGVAILELASELLMQSELSIEESGRVMSAVDAAIRILRPVTKIDDGTERRKALAELEAEERKAAAA